MPETPAARTVATDRRSAGPAATHAAKAPARLRLLRAGMRALSMLAPNLAVRAVDRLWFTPTHAPLRPEAQAFLAGGERLHLRVDGREIAGWSWGAGPAVLVLHGWGGHSGQMQPLAEALVAAGLRAVAIDGPGHGASQTRRPGDRRSSFIEVADALRAVAAELGPLAGLIAHSGGAAAVGLAVREGWTPPPRLVFLAPFVHPAAALEPFGRHLGVTPRVMAAFARHVERRFGRGWAEFDVAALPTARAVPPLLIVHDQEDAEVSCEGSHDLAQAWPQARLVLTRGLGHRRLLRDAAVVARAVDFVRGQAATAAPAIATHPVPADARGELDRAFESSGLRGVGSAR
ncbi:alpha/beta hydrolase [Luteimonas aquatica]|uniref:alpha/beta hydrolase n=1 Tax=Luteimonas aquatica TaxID=450364 RepID=UPI001F5A9A11|nr:alpha/beta fold hydrolase [Luteimonas aquatica]